MLFLAAPLQAPPPERKCLRKAGEAKANEGGAADARNPELPTSVPTPCDISLRILSGTRMRRSSLGSAAWYGTPNAPMSGWIPKVQMAT